MFSRLIDFLNGCLIYSLTNFFIRLVSSRTRNWFCNFKMKLFYKSFWRYYSQTTQSVRYLAELSEDDYAITLKQMKNIELNGTLHLSKSTALSQGQTIVLSSLWQMIGPTIGEFKFSGSSQVARKPLYFAIFIPKKYVLKSQMNYKCEQKDYNFF